MSLKQGSTGTPQPFSDALMMASLPAKNAFSSKQSTFKQNAADYPSTRVIGGKATIDFLTGFSNNTKKELKLSPK